jgi:hypothetical protein
VGLLDVIAETDDAAIGLASFSFYDEVLGIPWEMFVFYNDSLGHSTKRGYELLLLLVVLSTRANT